MSDAIAFAAPIASTAVAFGHAYPEAVGAGVAALLGLVLDGLTPQIKILHDSPWLLNAARWGISKIGCVVRDSLSKGK